MKIKKIIPTIALLLITILIVGCTTDPNDNKGVEGTPFTDALKLTASYAGKSFVNDGIGEVKLDRGIDGDTAIFKDIITGETFMVRFNGIDTPESTYKVEEWGFAAAHFTTNKLTSATKIVLETDTVKTARFDSTGNRYLAWVWYLPAGATDFRLLPLEIIENSYSFSKSSGTMYSGQLQAADTSAMGNKIRIHNSADKDPKYDYSKYGKYYTLKELRQYTQAQIDAEKDKGIKVRVQGIVAATIGRGSAYIQQQEDGNWYIGQTDTGISASTGDIPYIGENGSWYIGETDLGVKPAGGMKNQTAYQYYAAKTEEPLSEQEWLKALAVASATDTFETPYIVKDMTWYGMYLYGGNSDVNKFVSGREVFVEGNLGYYGGAMQIVGASNSTVGIISPNRVEPFVKTLTLQEFNSLGNKGLGCLVKMENLVVVNGYDTAANSGYTIYAEVNGVEVSIRVDKDVVVKVDKDGNFDPNGTVVVDSWEVFKGKTFKSITAVYGIYDGTYQLQLMGNMYFEIA